MFIVDSFGLLFGAMFLNGFLGMIFSIVFIVAAILLAECEAFSATYVAVFVYGILLTIFTPVNPFVFIWHEPATAIGFVLVYFVIGAGLSIPKYRTVVKHIVDKLKNAKQGFIDRNKLPIELTQEIPDDYINAWKEYKVYNIEYKYREKLDNGLDPINMSTYIMNWIAFWPFLLIGMFIADPLKAIVTFIYDQLGSVYGRIYAHLTSGLNVKDLK